MNKVCLIGRLTSKPELRYTTNDIALSRFILAVNSGYGDNQKTDFINVIVWRKQAENVWQYLDKGSLVSIEGRIQTGSYKDKDGNNRYSFDVVAETVQFLENKKGQSTEKVTPEEIEQHRKEEDNDPFADFGNTVEIQNLDDNFLD